MKSHVPKDTVDRIYRSLFVYSVGFSELIKSALEHTSNNYILISNIWKVFSILLEYCSSSDYQLMINKVSVEHREEMKKANERFEEKMLKYVTEDKEMKETIRELQVVNHDLKEELNKSNESLEKLDAEIQENKKNHEKEVSMRLKFESKLNHLHSLYREIEIRYDRACEDIDKLTLHNQTLIKLTDHQRSTISTLTSK